MAAVVIKEEAKQCTAQHVGLRGQPCRTPTLAVPLAPELLQTFMLMDPPAYNDCQCPAMHPLALQRRPEQRVLHAVIGLLKIHKGCEQGVFLKFGAEMTQGKELMLCGHVGTESGLARVSEPTILKPADNALIEDGRIQKAEGLPNRYVPVVCWIGPVTFLENWGHQGGLYALLERRQAEMQHPLQCSE